MTNLPSSQFWIPIAKTAVAIFAVTTAILGFVGFNIQTDANIRAFALSFHLFTTMSFFLFYAKRTAREPTWFNRAWAFLSILAFGSTVLVSTSAVADEKIVAVTVMVHLLVAMSMGVLRLPRGLRVLRLFPIVYSALVIPYFVLGHGFGCHQMAAFNDTMCTAFPAFFIGSLGLYAVSNVYVWNESRSQA